MKKRFVTILSLVCAFCLCFGLSACAFGGSDNKGNNPAGGGAGSDEQGSDPTGGGSDGKGLFIGTISEETFQSAEKAARGFLDTEISGIRMLTEFVSYHAERELSQDEIDSLELGEYAQGLKKAEEGKVEYKQITSPSAEAATQTRSVYILTYTDSYRYFAPPAKTGETLTASYFAAIMDEENYQNCTFETVQQAVDYGLSQVSKGMVTADKIWQCKECNFSMGSNGSGPNTSEEMKGEAYWIKDGDITHYVNYIEGSPEQSTDGWEYAAASSDGENSFQAGFDNAIDTMLVTQMIGRFDFSWFVKTSSGFSLRNDLGPDMALPFSYDATVRNGRVEYICAYVNPENDPEFGVERGKFESKIYDFGKTVVEIPAEVSSLIAENKKRD